MASQQSLRAAPAAVRASTEELRRVIMAIAVARHITHGCMPEVVSISTKTRLSTRLGESPVVSWVRSMVGRH